MTNQTTDRTGRSTIQNLTKADQRAITEIEAAERQRRNAQADQRAIDDFNKKYPPKDS